MKNRLSVFAISFFLFFTVFVTVSEAGVHIIGEYGTIDNAVRKLASENATLWIDVASTQTSTIISNSTITVPSNISVIMEVPGSIDLSKNNLTIQGPFSAGLFTVFVSNTKSVVFDTRSVKEVYPEWWGAKGDDITDSTAAVRSAVNAHRSVHFAGKYQFGTITLTVGKNNGQTFTGNNPTQTFLTNNSSGDMFNSGGGWISLITFKDLSIVNPSTGGHIFNDIFSDFATVDNVYIVQNNPNKSILRQVSNGPANSIFKNGRWSANTGGVRSSVPAIDIRVDNDTNFFNLVFDNIMFDGTKDDTVVYARFNNFRLSGLGASWGPTIRNCTFEVMGGGGIEIDGAFQPVIDQVSFDDLFQAPNNPLIKITNNAAGLETRSPFIRNVYAMTGYSTPIKPDLSIRALSAQIHGSYFGYGEFPYSDTYSTLRPTVFGSCSSIGGLVGASTYIRGDAGCLDGLISNPSTSNVFAVSNSGVVFHNASPLPIPSASFIVISSPITFISGANNIQVIGLSSPLANWSAGITLIPTGAWTMTATAGEGHIAKAVRAVVGQALNLYYDTTTKLWYPSY